MSTEATEEVQRTAERVLCDMREKIALLGAFDPVADEWQMSGDVRVRVLNALAADCVELNTSDRPLWRLKPQARLTVLAQLRGADRLSSVARAAAPAQNDVFGQLLVGAVLGQPTDLARMDYSTLDELHTAMQFVEKIEPPAQTAAKSAPQPSSVQIETRILQHERELQRRVLLDAPLLGRKAELDRMFEFVGAESMRSDELLLVYGVGGSGKSALLAEFGHRARRRAPERVVVVLDCDRAAINRGGCREMMREIAIQIGVQRPALAEEMARFREEIAEQEDAFDASPDADYDVWARDFSELMSSWRDRFGDRLAQLPLVVVMDTFEELLLGSERQAERVSAWLSSLRTEGGVAALKGIISARAFPEQWQARMESQVPGIALGDLDASAAERLLRRLLAKEGQNSAGYPIRALCRRYGGGPLTLILLARYLAETDDAGRSALSEKGRSGFQSRHAQSFLYTRILGRLRGNDPDVARLAHPGLVLRRVTADLIIHVLARHCGLGDIDSARAGKIMAELARHYWLVESSPDRRAVHHRKELRRLMLPDIESEQPQQARKIHAAAVEYYRAARCAVLDEKSQELEAWYHTCFLPELSLETVERSRELARALIAHVGEDFTTLPLERRARLRLAAGQTMSLEEEASLPVAAQRLHASFRIMRELEFDAAPKSSVYRYGVQTRSRQRLNDLASYVNSEFARGRIRSIEAIGADFVSAPTNEALVRSLPDMATSNLMSSPLWRISMAMLLSRHRQRFAYELAGAVVRRKLSHRSFEPQRPGGVTWATAAAMVLVLLDENPEFLPSFDISGRGGPEAWDELRARQLLHPFAPAGDGIELRIGALSYLHVPTFERIREAVKSTRSRERLSALSDKIESGKSLRLMDLQVPRSLYEGIWLNERWKGSASRALRTTSPELYPCVRGAIRPADDSILVSIANELQQQSAAWPMELRSKELRAALHRDRSRWLSVLIEFSDRCGLLGDLLRACRRHLPKGGSLDQVIALHRAYDKQLRGALSAQQA